MRRFSVSRDVTHASILNRFRRGMPVVFLATCSMFLAHTGRAAVVCAGPSTVEGIDVSHFQLSVDWNQVAASGVAFATAQVSSGLTADANFATNYAGIKAAGMIRGAYQFFRPGQDPVAQANLLLANTGSIGSGDLPPVLDIEVTDGLNPPAVAAAIQTWVTTVQNATGRTPILYFGAFFWNSSVQSSAFSSNPLWIAAWNVGCPTLPNAWSNWAFWQYTGSGSVPGVSGQVDRDKFNGTIDALRTLAGVQTVAVQPTTWGSIKAMYR
jgi:lysozyme